MADAASDQGVVEVEPVVHIVEVIEEEQEGIHYPADEFLDLDLLQTTVPDPIRLRGVGGTTV